MPRWSITRLKLKTQIIVRGVRLWPLEWRYIFTRVVFGTLDVTFFFMSVFAAALLAPGVPELARDPEMMNRVYLLTLVVPAEYYALLPLSVVVLFMGQAVGGLYRLFLKEE